MIEKLEDVEVQEGGELILTCKANQLCDDVDWNKDCGNIPPRASKEISAVDNLCVFKLVIDRTKEIDSGRYSCRSRNFVTTCNVIVKPLVICNIYFLLLGLFPNFDG